MALTYLTVQVANPNNKKKSLKKRLLVDSGAVYSVLPKEELKKLGIKPDSRQKFILANNKEIEKEVGEARFYLNGSGRTTPVVFGDPGVYLLGAVTLETMGLIIDPINRKIEPLKMTL
jgi:clan AA aspartic protease